MAQVEFHVGRYIPVLSLLFESPTKQGYVAIELSELRLGMQMWVDLPWYKHPFPTNRFKLTTLKQLQTIREQALTHLFYHPTLSDPEPEPRPDRELVTEGRSLQQLLGDQPGSSAGQLTEPSRVPRAAFQQANALYAHTLRRSREVLRQITKGDGTEATAAAKGIVAQFAQQLSHADTSLGLADVLHLSGLDQPQAVHGVNTCLLALLVGRDLGLTSSDLSLLGLASLLHDVGEQRLPSSLRYKTAFTRSEHLLFQEHPTYSRDILRDIPSVPPEVPEIIVQHHELLDGSGYPRGLGHETIHPLAQIIRVIDAYHELVNPGTGKNGLQPNQALSELYVKRSAQLSLKVIATLVRALGVYPPGTRVQLSDRSIGIVATVNPIHRLRPMVMVYELGGREWTSHLVDLDQQSDLAIVRMVGLEELATLYGERMNPQEVLHFMLVTDGQNSTESP